MADKSLGHYPQPVFLKSIFLHKSWRADNLLVPYFSKTLGQIGLAIRLVKKGEIRVGAAAPSQRIEGVSRGEQNFEAGSQLLGALSQIEAADASGHDNIGEQ